MHHVNPILCSPSHLILINTHITIKMNKKSDLSSLNNSQCQQTNKRAILCTSVFIITMLLFCL